MKNILLYVLYLFLLGSGVSVVAQETKNTATGLCRQVSQNETSRCSKYLEQTSGDSSMPKESMPKELADKLLERAGISPGEALTQISMSEEAKRVLLKYNIILSYNDQDEPLLVWKDKDGGEINLTGKKPSGKTKKDELNQRVGIYAVDENTVALISRQYDGKLHIFFIEKGKPTQTVGKKIN